MSTPKRGRVATLAAALAAIEVYFYVVGGWLLVIATGAVWGAIAAASLRAERTLTARVAAGSVGPCSDRWCFTRHRIGEDCRCACGGTRCGAGA